MDFQTLRDFNLQRNNEGWKHRLNDWSVAEWGNATAGEVGEACNIAKKLLRLRQGLIGNRPSATETSLRQELADEIADFVIYADLWAASEDISLEDAIRHKFNETSRRIGFTPVL
jgi:NTP pyrophosphatase (non-canonical NTP hydrolase)